MRVALVLALLAAPVMARAAGGCGYDGVVYQQGVAVCQSGVVQLCMDGQWQNQGRFCSEESGTALGTPNIGPGQVEIVPEGGMVGGPAMPAED